MSDEKKLTAKVEKGDHIQNYRELTPEPGEWDFLSSMSPEALEALLGPTVEKVMAEDFDEKTIAKILNNAEVKAEHIKALSRQEASAKSAATRALKTMREKAGVSQREMARRLEISPPAVSKMESGDPLMSSVLMYAEALGNKLSLIIRGPSGDATLQFDLEPPASQL